MELLNGVGCSPAEIKRNTTNFPAIYSPRQRMKKMKKLLALVTITSTVLIVACSGGAVGDPKGVAKKFFEAMKQMNFEEAQKYATKDSENMFNLFKLGMNLNPNSDSLKGEFQNQKFEYGDAVINGDEATVTVTMNDKETTDVKLKKEEGEWKVAFDKNTVFQQLMDKANEDPNISEQELQNAKDALESLTSDSLQNIMNKTGDAMKEVGKALEEAGEKMKEKQ